MTTFGDSYAPWYRNLPDPLAMSSASSDTIRAELALDEAVANATAALGSVGLSEETRAKAAELIKGSSADGMREARKVMIAAGMPAAALLLKQLVDFGSALDPIKASLKRSIDAACGGGETVDHVCQEVAFFNRQTGKADVARIRLDECPANHDFTAEQNKLAPHVPVAKRPEIDKHMSMLVYLGRSVYAAVVKDHGDLLRQIVSYLPRGSDRIDATVVAVDPTNTTLCVHPGTPKRVGIFVTIDSLDGVTATAASTATPFSVSVTPA